MTEPTGVTTQAQPATASELSPSMSAMLGQEPSTPAVSPTENTENANTSPSVPVEGQTSATDDNSNKLPETIPYSRFQEVIGEKNTLKADYESVQQKYAQMEAFLNDPSAVQRYAQDLQKATQGKVDAQVQAGVQPSKLDEQITKLDVFSDTYQQDLKSLLELNNQAIVENIKQSIVQEREDSKLVQEQEVILTEIFKGRPAEERQKAEQYIIDWVKANPGAKFPFAGEKGWKQIDAYVNPRTESAKEQGRKEVASAEEGKKIIASGNYNVPSSASGNSYGDIPESMRAMLLV